MKPQLGDKVKILTEVEKIEGMLMPRPKILDQNFTVIKLDNGYNIGIGNKKIKKIEVIEKFKEKKEVKKKLKHNKNLPTVSVLSFGGTISSKVYYRTGGVYADYTAEDFIEMVPELAKVANLKARKVEGLMSEDMNHEDWQLIAREVSRELNKDVAGVVVTQGTDTLHFSTAALSFFLKNLNKPVVFTASQRSIDRGSSDAFMNLCCSVNAAAKSNIAEVMTCLHGTPNDDYCLLIRGTKVRKMHSSRRDAFRPINELPLAKVYENGKIEYTNKNHRKKNSNKVILDSNFEERVALIQIYPGINPEIIDFYLDRNYKGIVLVGTALGHVPTVKPKYSFMPKLKKAVEKKIPIIIASQTLYGRVHPYVYTNLRKLSIELNSIFVEDMLPEVAYVKLGWALGKTRKPDEVKKLMLQNFAGELTDRSLYDSFL